MAGGRQRQFDIDAALDSAMRVFWEKGYAGSSLTELTHSMGINKPSMYATFGNKEALFIQAVDHYTETYSKKYLPLLHQENKALKQRLYEYATAIIEMQCDQSTPAGCYLVECISDLEGETIPVRASEAVRKAVSFHEAYLNAFLKEEKQKGNLNSETSEEMISLYLLTFFSGVSSLLRGGKSKKDIDALLNLVFEKFPA